MPNLSLVALSLCAVLSLTGAPSAFAADITSGGGAGGKGLSSGGSGGLAGGGGAGGGGNTSSGVGGSGATLTTNAGAGGNSTSAGGAAPTGLASGGGGGGLASTGGPGGTGATGNVDSSNNVDNDGIIQGNVGGSTTAGGGGGGAGGGLVLTNSSGVTLNNSGFILGGAGGGSAATGFTGGGGGGGAGLVLVNGAGGTITNTGAIGGGNGGNAVLGPNGGGGAGVFLVDGGTLKNEGGTIRGGAAGAGNTTSTSASHSGTGGAGILSNRGVIENSGNIFGGKAQTAAGTANSGVIANGGTITNSATGMITGGDTTHSSSSTVGGNGVELVNDGGATLINKGTISGGATASTTGGGGTGVKVSSNGNTVINAGAINGTGTQNAVTLSGNNNTLQLQANYSFTGNVVSSGTGNMLALGGQTDASFDVSKISAAGQFRGFSSYQKLDDSTWTLTGTASLATDWDIQAGTLHLTDAGALNGGSVDLTGGVLSAESGTFTGNVNLKQDDGTINITNGETADFSGDITGDGNLIKTGTGTLLLSSVKSYTGDTLINEGELKAGVADALVNSSALTINQGSTFNLNNLVQTVNQLSGAGNVSLGSATLTANNASDLVFSGMMSGTGGFTKAGDSALSLDTVQTYTGATAIIGGEIKAGVADALVNSSSLTISQDAVFNLNDLAQMVSNLSGAGNVSLGTATLTANNTTDSLFSGVMSGTGGLTKTGDGVLSLDGVQTYTGATTITGGEIKAGVADTLASSNALSINQGSAFNLNDFAQTVNALSGKGNVLLGSATLIANNAIDSLFSGSITGSGGLSKTGSNTLTLSGLNSSLGAIDVQQGTLSLKQDGVLTSTDYVTQNGATTFFSGSGSQLSTGTFTQEAGSFLKVNFGEDWTKPVISADQVNLDGTLIFNGFAEQENPVSATQAEARNYHLIESGTDISGAFNNEDVSLVSTGLDYLLHEGYIAEDKRSYNLGFHLAWTTDKNESATGNFTLNTDTAFNIDIALNDRIVPENGFNSQWDGKSLLKDGEGRLVLSEKNGYTGLTTLLDGILEFATDNSIASSSDVIVKKGLVVLNGYAQLFNRLSGEGGTINIDGTTLTANNASSADNSLYAGALTGNGTLVKTGLGRLTLSGDTLWSGDTELREGELVLDGVNGGARLASNIIGQRGTQLKLLNGANLTGWIDPTDVEIDSSSLWNMTASSQIDTLTNNGMISFAESTEGDFKTLTVHGNYQGDNGLLVLNTQLDDDNSLTDKLVIEGDTSGTTQVQINNAGGSGAETLHGIEVITVGGQSNGEFVQSGRIAAGAYDYKLARGADSTKNWYLKNLDDTPTERPEAGAYGANQAAANNMFLTSVHDRVEQTPYIDVFSGEKKMTSLWLRNEGSHNRFRNESGQLKTQANRYVLQLGGDIALLSHSGSDLFQLGAMAGYGNSSSNTVSQSSGYSAKGKVDGYNVGIYGTWYANGPEKLGLYVDSWAQYSWLNNTISGEDLNTEKYKSTGITASIESGYTFKVAENAARNTHFFIQPKAQVTWMNVKAQDHQEANGSNIKSEGDGNIQTRLGVKGYAAESKGKGTTSNLVFKPFAEINWVHNTKQFGANMDGISLKQSGTSHIGEVKLGVEGQVNRQLDLWGNVAQQIGDKGYSNSSAMLGVKYNF